MATEAEIATKRVSPIETRHDSQRHRSLQSNNDNVKLRRVVLTQVTSQSGDVCNPFTLLDNRFERTENKDHIVVYFLQKVLP